MDSRQTVLIALLILSSLTTAVAMEASPEFRDSLKDGVNETFGTPEPSREGTETNGAGSEGAKAHEPTLNETKLALLIHEYVNDQREAYGGHRLEYEPQIESVADNYAEYMARTGWYNHTSPNGSDVRDRLQAGGYDCIRGESTLGGAENLMLAYYDTRVNLGDRTELIDTEEKLARAVVELWMDSDGHRDNILDPDLDAQGIGIGVNSSSEEDIVYIVQDFC